MSEPIDPLRCMRLNERRQAQAMTDLGDEHAPLGSGVLAWMEGAPWMCKAVGVDLDAPLTDEDVACVVDFYRSRGTSPVLELTAFSAQETFAAAARAGFALVEAEHVLSRSPVDLSVAVPEGVTIEPLDRDDAAAMRRHAEIVCSGFPPPDGRISEPLLAAAERSQRHPSSLGFFARLADGEPVAATGMDVSLIEPGGGAPATRVTALWGTTVLPDHRRRGIQQALIAHRLRVGLERGSELAVIESKPGIPTERNAARLGFTLTYTRLVLKA